MSWAMAYKAENFARSVYGDKRKNAVNIGNLVISKYVSNCIKVPSFSASDYDTRQFIKPILYLVRVRVCLQFAIQAVPSFMQAMKLNYTSRL